MDTQSVLTLIIQVIFMGFVSLMIFDFFGGLWVVPLPPVGWQPPQGEQPTVSATAPQFEEIPNPWSLEPQSPHHRVSSPRVIVPFPTIRLLPPAQTQQVQPTKPKRKSQTTKSAQPKSPKERKPRRMKAV